MNDWKHCPSAHRLYAVVALSIAFAVFASTLRAQNANATSFPQYDRVFLIVMESEEYNQIIGNNYAPILNALAKDYGLATNYTGVGDPSEPNYVAMLGGDTFGLSTDDPYWFPGHTINAANLMSQLEGAVRRGGAIFRTCLTPAIAVIAIRTNAMAFPTSTRCTSRNTMAW